MCTHLRSRITRFILLIALASPTLYADEPIDLTRAIDLALQQNRQLARSAVNLDSAAWGIKSAASDFALRVQPDANVGFSSDRDDWQYGLLVGKRLAWGTTVDVGGRATRTLPDNQDSIERATLEFTLRQPLFRNAGRLVNLENTVQAQNRLKQVRRQYHQQQADLIVDVVETFEEIIQLRARIDTDQAFHDRTDKLYRLTKAREKQGRATRVDLLRVELQLGQSLSRLENTRERLSATERSFAELLGFDPDKSFALVPPPLLDIQLASTAMTVQTALENRLDYAQVLQNHQDAARGVRIAKRNVWPDLSLVTRYERFSDGDRFSEAVSFDDDEWFVGIEADTDLNPARERAGIGTAKAEHLSSEQTIRIQELIITREVQQGITAYHNALANLTIAKRNVELGEKRARLARRLFELGRGDNFSVTDAEESYLTAQNNLLSARAEASITGYRLSRVTGIIIEYPDDLKPSSVERSS